MAHARLRVPALLFTGALLCLATPGIATAQLAAPAAAATLRGTPDSAATGRRVREFPIVFVGALGGAGVGLLAGGAIGAALASNASGNGDEWISPELAGAVAGASIGYAIGAGVGAHFAASSRPRPNAFATIGISVLSAATVGLAAGALGSSGLGESATAVLAAAVPVAHVALTAQFARWRAQRR